MEAGWDGLLQATQVFLVRRDFHRIRVLVSIHKTVNVL
jgi:hypothetical protein